MTLLKSEKQQLTKFLLLPLLLFTALYVFLSFHSRMAGGDYYYLWLRNNFGTAGGMLYQYDHWSGRWSAHLAGCWLIKYWRSMWMMPALHMVTLALLYFAIKGSIKKVFSRLIIHSDNFSHSLLSLFLASAFFF